LYQYYCTNIIVPILLYQYYCTNIIVPPTIYAEKFTAHQINLTQQQFLLFFLVDRNINCMHAHASGADPDPPPTVIHQYDLIAFACISLQKVRIKLSHIISSSCCCSTFCLVDSKRQNCITSGSTSDIPVSLYQLRFFTCKSLQEVCTRNSHTVQKQFLLLLHFFWLSVQRSLIHLISLY
jgi:hypothetical protein